jgi:hypothetical protein
MSASVDPGRHQPYPLLRHRKARRRPGKLHEEHTKVVRRVVTDPEFVKDIDWTDKSIEVTETARGGGD